jgi:hypothetical protein
MGALGTAACGGGAPATEAETAAPEPAAGAAGFQPVVSLNQVMVDVINEHAHSIWDIDIPGREPKTDEDWAALRHAGVTLAAAGSIAILGGSGPNDDRWLTMPDWQSMSQAMTDKGLQALVAAERRNVDALRTAGNELLLTCIQCHNAYRLAIPNIWAEREQRIPAQ